MARAFLLALWCATVTTAAAARYGDYSGARMPQYGPPEYDVREAARAHDDYRAHSPDAIDYNDDDLAATLTGKTELPVKEEKKEVEETDSWHKPARRQKKSGRDVDDHLPSVDRFNPEDDFPKAKTSSRFLTKHRPRLKSRQYEGNDEDLHAYLSIRDKHDDRDIQENEELGVKENYRNEKRKKLDDKSHYGRGERVARRKPRDKFDPESDRLSGQPDRLTELDSRPLGRDDKRAFIRDESRAFERDDNSISDRDGGRSDIVKSEADLERWLLMREGLGRAPEPNAAADGDEEGGFRPRPDLPIRDASLKILEQDESFRRPGAAKSGRVKGTKSKSYDEYQDYYDMKRVINIKNKLPPLIRRTTVREELYPRGPDAASSPASAPEAKLRPLPDSEEDPGRGPIPASEPDLPPGPSRSLQELMFNRRRFFPPPASTRATLTTTQATPATHVIPISTTVSTTTILSTSPTTAKVTPKNGTVLSLAEKSRLSILKKAQRKESVEGGRSTQKPPVLLQVTKKMPTLVMVEPPASEPFLRAREVHADSPARLDQVKRLMRHKLVASARNIHDLTDNWDDMVCDYIDMSLLDAMGAAESGRATEPSAAERELALLLGARRQRKEATSPAPAPDASPSHSPASTPAPFSATLDASALDPGLDHSWQAFIATNAALRRRLSTLVVFLAVIINYLEIYEYDILLY